MSLQLISLESMDGYYPKNMEDICSWFCWVGGCRKKIMIKRFWSGWDRIHKWMDYPKHGRHLLVKKRHTCPCLSFYCSAVYETNLKLFFIESTEGGSVNIHSWFYRLLRSTDTPDCHVKLKMISLTHLTHWRCIVNILTDFQNFKML